MTSVATPNLLGLRVLAVITAELAAHRPLHLKPTVTTDLEFDSLDTATVAIALEDAFDVAIPEEASAGWRTVADAVATVAGLVSNSNRGKDQ